MSTKAAERSERRVTGRERAAVYLLLVSWTREMTVEGVKGPESVVAEHTLIRRAIPRPICGVIPSVVTVGKESPRNGDHIITVIELDPTVDHPAIGTGWARPVLEVEYHGGLADKGFRATAVLERAWYIPWTMHAGVQVLGKASIRCRDDKVQCAHLTQIVLRAENAPALDTVGMTLTVVLMQAMSTLEEPPTYGAVVVLFEVV